MCRTAAAAPALGCADGCPRKRPTCVSPPLTARKFAPSVTEPLMAFSKSKPNSDPNATIAALSGSRVIPLGPRSEEESQMAEFNFQRFDKVGARLVKVPELTIQSKGTMSMNAAAHHLLGEPEAVEFLYDSSANVIGLSPVPPEDPHAYPLRGVGGKGNTNPNSFIVAGTAFLNFYKIPFGEPVRREVKLVDGVLIVDLNDPGRSAVSNRARAARAAADT